MIKVNKAFLTIPHAITDKNESKRKTLDFQQWNRTHLLNSFTKLHQSLTLAVDQVLLFQEKKIRKKLMFPKFIELQLEVLLCMIWMLVCLIKRNGSVVLKCKSKSLSDHLGSTLLLTIMRLYRLTFAISIQKKNKINTNAYQNSVEQN